MQPQPPPRPRPALPLPPLHPPQQQPTPLPPLSKGHGTRDRRPDVVDWRIVGRSTCSCADRADRDGAGSTAAVPGNQRWEIVGEMSPFPKQCDIFATIINNRIS